MVLLRQRIAILGESTSGKSAFVQMVHSSSVTFPKNYLMTMGCDFGIKELPLDDATSIQVFMLDVSGQRMYEKMVPTYLEDISAFIVVYDVSNKNTFETCKKWVDRARAKDKRMPGILLANKMDLMDKAEVTDSQGEIFARANNLMLFRASSLRGMGINEPIEELARIHFGKYQERVGQMFNIA